MNLALAIMGAVALQRFLELIYAERNTRALLARGAMEVGRRHYPMIVVLHGAWLVAIVVSLPPTPNIYWPALTIFLALQMARLWVIASLGPYWTTRIITAPEFPLMRRGPYRYLRHPNYVIVAGEIAALPLVFGELVVAVVFTLLNAGVLAWRIRVEDAALAARANDVS